jgi:hypothetical protein
VRSSVPATPVVESRLPRRQRISSAGSAESIGYEGATPPPARGTVLPPDEGLRGDTIDGQADGVVDA